MPPRRTRPGYGTAPLPSTRPPATGSYLAAQKTLGTPVKRYDEAAAAEWLAKVSDDLPLYRGGEGFIHPAFYLDQANKALSLNVKLGPWIHAGSEIQHLGAARLGQTLSTRGWCPIGLREKRARSSWSSTS